MRLKQPVPSMPSTPPVYFLNRFPLTLYHSDSHRSSTCSNPSIAGLFVIQPGGCIYVPCSSAGFGPWVVDKVLHQFILSGNTDKPVSPHHVQHTLLASNAEGRMYTHPHAAIKHRFKGVIPQSGAVIPHITALHTQGPHGLDYREETYKPTHPTLPLCAVHLNTMSTRWTLYNVVGSSRRWWWWM